MPIDTNELDMKLEEILKKIGLDDINLEVIEGEILQDSNARIIRDGTIVFNGKIGSIFREKNQAKQVSAGLECGITVKNFNDFQKKDIIEVYNSTITERTL